MPWVGGLWSHYLSSFGPTPRFSDKCAARIGQSPPFLSQNVQVKVPRNRPDGPDGGRGIELLFIDLGSRRGGW
jgi:hypothetical protein